jgi:hypothetical protein
VLNPTIYSAVTATLPEFTYTGAGSLQAFTVFATTDFGGAAYTVNGQYWNGSAWVNSNGTYAQASSASLINTNIASLPTASTLQINFITQASNTQMGLSALTMTYTGQLYPTTSPTIAPNAPLTMDSLNVFTDVFSASGSDGVQYYIKIGSTPYWYNGSAWAISNASYAQTNTSTVINTNASTLPISLGAFVTPYALIHSASGLTTPMLISLTLSYDFFGPEPTPPQTCLVFGYILDENEVPITGATVSVTNPTTFINSGIVIAQGVRTTKTDALGYFSMNLVETASMSIPAELTFSVAYTSSSPGGVGPGFTPTSFTFGAAVIPNVPESNITALTFM